MFESIISEISGQFGIGDKAPLLVRTILGHVTDPANGGLSGLMAKFDGAGLGAVAKSWLGATTAPAPLAPDDVDRVFGGSGGLVGQVTSKLGIPAATASAAVAAVLPLLIQKLTPGGVVPTTLPVGVAAFLGTDTASAGATHATAAVTGAANATGHSAAAASASAAAAGETAAAGVGLKRWLPWLIAALVLLALFLFFSRRQGTETTTTTADTTATVAAPAAPAAAPIPVGAGVTAAEISGLPSLTVYFDTAKAEIAPEFADKAGGIVGYARNNPGAKLVVSGYNDPRGDAAFNAELSKNRAQAVAAALEAAGVATASVVLEKPAETSGTGDTNAESRRVEVVVRQ